MKEKIEQLKNDCLAELASTEDAEAVRVKYLGRKGGLLTELLKGIKDLTVEEKREVGPVANMTKKELEAAFKEATASDASDEIDLTLPGIAPQAGHTHPLTQLIDQLIDIFRSMGFSVLDGPQLDSDYYNFEALNFPVGHPARDTQDTFFVKTKEKMPWMMRTQTSNMQIHHMENNEPPLRAIVPGRVFRNEATDATHEHTFYQLEGFVVDKDVTVGQLTWTLREIFRQIYGDTVDVRLRPGYFPFVEPGYEVDVYTPEHGWLEMAGAGMIHPNVFRSAGYEEGKFTGFAFGLGIMRVAMLKHDVKDIRLWMQNDLRFLHQL
jgi:phenylalanyl-tRNA synthetase alpha chain